MCLFYCSGLCAVYRSKAGEFEPSSDSPTHNSHWLMKNKIGGGGGPSRYVGYYDATSLYPSSSKNIFNLLFCFKFSRAFCVCVCVCVTQVHACTFCLHGGS